MLLKVRLWQTEELYKPVISADFMDMQLISKFCKRFRFLSCAIDIYSKYLWFFSLNNKKCITNTDASQKYVRSVKLQTKQNMGG